MIRIGVRDCHVAAPCLNRHAADTPEWSPIEILDLFGLPEPIDGSRSWIHGATPHAGSERTPESSSTVVPPDKPEGGRGGRRVNGDALRILISVATAQRID